MIQRRQVLVQDELDGVRGKITWQVHTKAKIDLLGRHAVLHLNGETLHAQIVAPSDAQFATEPASAPPPQHQQPDVQKLIIRPSAVDGSVRIAVVFTPGKAEPGEPAPLVPLAAWSRDR
jgi:hypothetical protein